MAEEKLVNLDDPVRGLLPEGVKVPARGDKEITLVSLSTHSSALPRVPLALLFAGLDNPYAKFQPEQLYEALAATELQKDIGAQSEYSNLGVGLLGHALALRAGTTYEELVKQRVCEPLSLGDTTITLSDDQRTRLATGHTAEGEPTSNWDFDALAGAGAIRSTAHDMLRFASAQLGLTETPLAAAIATSQQVHFDGEGGRYGLGWVLQKVRGDELDFVWHNGGTGGYCSFLGLVKQKQLGLIVLCNTSLIGRGSAADEVANGVLRSLMEE
jgi:CubicO group peptidase (beta-lactamase class C family)